MPFPFILRDPSLPILLRFLKTNFHQLYSFQKNGQSSALEKQIFNSRSSNKWIAMTKWKRGFHSFGWLDAAREGKSKTPADTLRITPDCPPFSSRRNCKQTNGAVWTVVPTLAPKSETRDEMENFARSGCVTFSVVFGEQLAGFRNKK